MVEASSKSTGVDDAAAAADALDAAIVGLADIQPRLASRDLPSLHDAMVIDDDDDVNVDVPAALRARAAALGPEAWGGAAPAAGRFEWVDGVLLKAAVKGEWVLLENANLCSPTVLDRLNPLLEIGGSLLVGALAL